MSPKLMTLASSQQLKHLWKKTSSKASGADFPKLADKVAIDRAVAALPWLALTEMQGSAFSTNPGTG